MTRKRNEKITMHPVYSPPDYNKRTTSPVDYVVVFAGTRAMGILWTDRTQGCGFIRSNAPDANAMAEWWLGVIRQAYGQGTTASDLFDYWAGQAGSQAMDVSPPGRADLDTLFTMVDTFD